MSIATIQDTILDPGAMEQFRDGEENDEQSDD
jgi:hypothetical protein